MIRRKTRYHLTPDGPKICTADKISCQYGGTSDHGTDLLQMKIKYEQRMENTILLAKALVDSEQETSRVKLQKLARHKDLRVRRNVAKNPNTAPEILEKLSKEKDEGSEALRADVASNENTSAKTLTILSNDDDMLVSHRAIANRNISKEELNRAVMSGHLFKQVAAASNSSGNLSQASVEKLFETRDVSVYHALYENPTIPEDLKSQTVIHPSIARAVIDNPFSNSEMVEKAWFVMIDGGVVPDADKVMKHKGVTKVILEHMLDVKDYSDEVKQRVKERIPVVALKL